MENNFVLMLKDACLMRNTSPYKVALDAGVDPALVSSLINGKRTLKPEQMEKLIQKLSQSKLLDVDYNTLMAWWALTMFPAEALKRALEESSRMGFILESSKLDLNEYGSLLPCEPEVTADSTMGNE